MTLKEIITALATPDHISEDQQKKVLDMEVQFNTSTRFNMELLSVYVDDEGKIQVDVD